MHDRAAPSRLQRLRLSNQPFNGSAWSLIISVLLVNFTIADLIDINQTSVDVQTCTGSTKQQWFQDRAWRLRPFSAVQGCLAVGGANDVSSMKFSSRGSISCGIGKGRFTTKRATAATVDC